MSSFQGGHAAFHSQRDLEGVFHKEPWGYMGGVVKSQGPYKGMREAGEQQKDVMSEQGSGW